MLKIQPYSPEENDFKDEDIVCFCFGYTKKDIAADCRVNNSHSTILERIAREKKAGRCPPGGGQAGKNRCRLIEGEKL